MNELERLHRDVAELLQLVSGYLDNIETRDELTRALADRVLQLAEVVNREVDSTNKNTDALLLVRQRLTEIYDQREFLRSGQEDILRRLAVISKDVDDVERVTREATGAHRLVAPEEPAMVGLLKAFAALPRSTQWLVLVALGIIAGAGWIYHLAR